MSETGTETTTAPSLTISNVLSGILSGVESGLVTVVTAVLAIFMPQLIGLSAQAINRIGQNFQTFLTAIKSGSGGSVGTPWGTALADMMTADWNEVEDDAKQVAIDFAEAVATALENMGLLPQGK